MELDAANIIFTMPERHNLPFLHIFRRDLQTVGEILFWDHPRMVATGTETRFQIGEQWVWNFHPYIRTDSVMHIRQVGKRCTERLPDGLLSEANKQNTLGRSIAAD